MDDRSDKDIILEFLNEKKFQKASKEIQKLDDDYEKMADVVVGLVNWRDSDENAKIFSKLKNDLEKQKKQLLQLRDEFRALGGRHIDQWWKEIADVLATTPSAYEDDDLDVREEKAQIAAEEGNYGEVNSILSSPEWKEEIKLLGKILEEERARCRRYISGQKCRIKNLCMNTLPKDEVIKIYEEITHLAEKYQIEYHILLEYAEFLYSQKEYNKGIEIADRLNRHYELQKSTSDVDKAKLYIQLGELYYETNQFEESIRFCKEADKILERDPYRYIKERAQLYRTIAGNYWRTNRSDEAKNYAGRALELFKRCNELTDEESLSWASAYRRLAVLLRREWNLDGAEDCYKKALGIEENLYGKNPNNDKFAQALAATCSNLGILYRQMKKYDEGEKYYEQSYKIRERKYRNSDDLNFNWPFALTTSNYAYLLACKGKQIDAETKMEEIVLPIKKSLFERYPNSEKYRRSYAFSLKDYGFILSRSDSNDDGKWEVANEKFLKSLNLIKQSPKKDSNISGDNKDLMADINFEYGLLLKKMGREQEAILRFQKAFEIYQVLKKNSPYYVHDIEIVALELAELLSRRKGTWAEAEIAYQHALDFSEEIPEISRKYHQDDYKRILKGLIGILQLQDRPEDQLKVESLKEKLAKCEMEGSAESL